MSQLTYDEIKERKYIVFNGEPWEVLTSHVFRKQQRKPVNATKLRNLITGKVTEHSFHVSEKAEEAELSTKNIKFIYERQGEYWFNEEGNASKRFALGSDQVGFGGKFLKKDAVAKAMIFDDKIIVLEITRSAARIPSACSRVFFLSDDTR